MFPTAHNMIYRNEAGEVVSWDSPQYYEPEYFDCCGVIGRCACDDTDEDDIDELSEEGGGGEDLDL